LLTLAFLCRRRGEDGHARALFKRLLALNPDDKYGLRAILMDVYLRAGEDPRALAIAAAYPDDVHAEVAYGRVLALYRLGRRGEALTAFAEAYRSLPLVADYLAETRSKLPRLLPEGIRIGGADQAWIYHQETGDLWREVPGLLDWMKAAHRGLAKRGRR